MGVEKIAEAEGAPPRNQGTQTLERGLELLETAVRHPMRLVELASRAGLSRSTAARLVSCLVDHELLVRLPNGEVRAGPKMIELGAIAESRTDLVSIAAPYLQALSARAGVSSFLGRRDGDFSVHLHCAAGSHTVIVTTPVGTRRRLAETSLGRALMLDDHEAVWERMFNDAKMTTPREEWLSGMRKAVEAQVIFNQGPPPDSIRAIAAPVRNASGRIVAAISVATIAQYLDDSRTAELSPIVRETAEAISRGLGWHRSGR
jgi:DNA-binding IclR family transcriptional regulator